jgi:hypothetical protein
VTPTKRTALGVILVVIAAAWGAACTSRPPASERHPLPRLPELGSVVLPGGFVAYDKPTAPYASRHPIHVDSAFFELDPSNDIGGNHHCRAQITISPYDAKFATPPAYADQLGTKLCDADWFATQFLESWHPDPTDPNLWTVEFPYTKVGWLSVYELPAVGVVLFEPERHFTVGFWALTEDYSREAAVALVREVARSVR